MPLNYIDPRPQHDLSYILRNKKNNNKQKRQFFSIVSCLSKGRTDQKKNLSAYMYRTHRHYITIAKYLKVIHIMAYNEKIKLMLRSIHCLVFYSSTKKRLMASSASSSSLLLISLSNVLIRCTRRPHFWCVTSNSQALIAN